MLCVNLRKTRLWSCWDTLEGKFKFAQWNVKPLIVLIEYSNLQNVLTISTNFNSKRSFSIFHMVNSVSQGMLFHGRTFKNLHPCWIMRSKYWQMNTDNFFQWDIESIKNKKGRIKCLSNTKWNFSIQMWAHRSQQKKTSQRRFGLCILRPVEKPGRFLVRQSTAIWLKKPYPLNTEHWVLTQLRRCVLHWWWVLKIYLITCFNQQNRADEFHWRLEKR